MKVNGHEIAIWFLAYCRTFGLVGLIGFVVLWIKDFGDRTEAGGGKLKSGAIAATRAAGFIFAMAVVCPLVVAVMAGVLAVVVFPLILIKGYLVDAYWTHIEGAVKAGLALLLYAAAIWGAIALHGRFSANRAGPPN